MTSPGRGAGRIPDRVLAVPPIPRREPDTHKGTYGRVLIVAGSREMPGAAVLAVRAALRSGAGLVTAAVPRSIGGIVGTAAPEATQVLLPADLAPADLAAGNLAAADLLSRLEGGADSVGLGPGLGASEAAEGLVRLVLERARCPVVIDADAINAIARLGNARQPVGSRPEIAPARPELCVWTPHPGELQRLAGERPRGEAERVAAAARLAEQVGGVVVLKGHGTVVCDRTRSFVNATGNPGMATGGSGDVLTGMLASFLAQGFAPFDAAVLAVHLHGVAGDIALATLGEAGLIAGDIADRIPAAILSHQGNPPRGA